MGSCLDRGVVIVDAEAGREAERPADAGHALAGEVGEEFVRVVAGLGGVGVVDGFESAGVPVMGAGGLRSRRSRTAVA